MVSDTCSSDTDDEPTIAAIFDGSHSTTMVSGLFDPRVAAWMSDTGSTDKALEFEALCYSRLEKPHTGGWGGWRGVFGFLFF